MSAQLAEVPGSGQQALFVLPELDIKDGKFSLGKSTWGVTAEDFEKITENMRPIRFEGLASPVSLHLEGGTATWLFAATELSFDLP